MTQYGSTQRTCSEAEAKAASLGRVVRYPKPDELFIDIDSNEELTDFFRRRARLIRTLNSALSDGLIVEPSPSKRPGRFHVTLLLKRPVRDEAERILLQACLGSDPVRELMNAERVREGSEAPNVFFENAPPDALLHAHVVIVHSYMPGGLDY